MPELTLYFSKKDEREFVRYVLEHGAWLVPDLDYRKPKYMVIRTEKTYQAFRRRSGLFFVLRDSYFQSPLEIGSVEKRGKIIHYISQRNGGPTIEFLPSIEFRERAHKYISMGSIGHYPTYWNTISCSMEKPPEALRSFYKFLVKWIKRKSIRIKPGVRTYWVGKHAVEAVRRGVRLDGLPAAKVSSLLGRPQRRKRTRKTQERYRQQASVFGGKRMPWGG